MKLEPCEPPRWANNGHSQTILGHILPSPLLSTKGRRVEIPLPDGDRLVGFIQEGTSGTLVYIFHGLAGSTDSTYIHRTAMVALKRGHSVFLVNHRGCGEGAGLTRNLYHSGRAEDLGAAIAAGRMMYPHLRHVAIGFSMSGNALLLLLSGRRGEHRPDAGISVNAPIHLESVSQQLSSGFNRVYDIRFYLQCRRDVFAMIGSEKFKRDIPYMTTLREFDQIFTAPAGGFRDRDDYYQSCSTHQLLDSITTPTVVLTSEDDPFVPVADYHSATMSKQILFHAEKFGGHMGYWNASKTPYGSRRWQDYAIDEALKALGV